ncbi:hypothetical protein NL676_009550 [Syzygium grande]|nr:hypothetical protein NL676_009550 [Syzygium grande]
MTKLGTEQKLVKEIGREGGREVRRVVRDEIRAIEGAAGPGPNRRFGRGARLQARVVPEMETKTVEING